MAGILGSAPPQGQGILSMEDVPELKNSHGGSFVSGILGGLADAFTLPRRVYEGSVDLNTDKGLEEVLNASGSMGLSARAMLAANPNMVPAGAFGMFAGRAAKTANIEKLAQAEALAAQGADARKIWDETGWFQGADGKWRFEIDDSASQIGTKAQEELAGTGNHGASQRSASGVLWHKDLYEAYPQFRQIDVDGRYNAGLSQMRGSYQDIKPGHGDRPQIEFMTNAIDGPEGPRSILLHEMQHAAQSVEDFARGGAPDGSMAREFRLQMKEEAQKFIEMFPEGSPVRERLEKEGLSAADWDQMARHVYRRLAGEVEARNVQTRRDMTPEERRAKAPWETEDVPRDQQIIRHR